MNRRLKFTMLAVAFMAITNVNAQIKLAGIFTDNMVLQQNQKVKIWGTAKAGVSVSIEASWNKHLHSWISQVFLKDVVSSLK